MGRVVRLLMIEDSANDAELIRRELQRAGFEINFRRIDNRDDLNIAMDEPWDIILSDHDMPKFDSITALKLIRLKNDTTPFILVSGDVGEETIVEAMRWGCRDYVMKNDLIRLGPTVERELKEADARIERKLMEAEMMREREMYAVTLKSIGDGVITADMNGRITFINKVAEVITGWDCSDAVHSMLCDIFHVIDKRTREIMEVPIGEVLRTGKAAGLKNYATLVARDGIERFISANIAPIKNNGDMVVGAVVVFRDITRIRQAEEQLANERTNLKSIFDAAPVGMIILRPEMIVDQVNETALRILNRHGRGVLDERFGNAFHCLRSLDNEDGCGYGQACIDCKLRKAVEAVFRDGVDLDNLELQYTFVKNRAATDYWLKVSAVPIEIGGAIHVVVAIDDITEVKKIEEEIARSRDFYLTLLEEFPALIWQAGSDGQSNFFNSKYLEFTGRTFEEEYGEGWVAGLHPDDRRRCSEIYWEAFRQRLPFEREYRLRRYDGEYRWILDVGRPFSDLEGRFAGYIGVCHDITERKKAEEGLKRYEILSKRARDIIIFIDRDGRILEANDAAIQAYGYTREEFLQKSVKDMRALEEQTVFVEQLEQADKKGILFETVHRRKDGSLFPVEVSSQGTTIGGNKILLSIIRDITERKQAEAELKRAKEDAEAANRAKSEFLANMSHEIRTPLNGIIGMTDLTLMTELSEEAKDNLQVARSCADALLTVINDVLDYSKIEAGKLPINKVSMDLRGLVEQLVRIHAVRAREKGLSLTTVIDPDLPSSLEGDDQRVQQILNNLMANAVKFTEIGGITVRLKCRRLSEQEVEVKFKVVDTGIGIAPEERGRLFQSFSQVDGSITRKYGGTGLGLAISKRLVEMMGGTITVQSKKGRGSEFSFAIPFKRISSFQGASSPSSPAQSGAGVARPLDVLLVEDDKINQVLVVRMLERLNHRVRVACHGAEALEIWRDHPVDLILMDIQMPVMDGVEATKRIRAEETALGVHIPIVALTAYALQGDRERFLAAGMDDYLSKPLDFALLQKTLEQHSNTLNVKARLRTNSKEPFTQNVAVSETALSADEVRAFVSHIQVALVQDQLSLIERHAGSLKELAGAAGQDIIRAIAFKITLASRKGEKERLRELLMQLIQAMDKMEK